MRVESLGPRTLLLATLAGWAVLVAILALAGLGSRITPLADDPGSAPRLPAVPKAAPERLGTLAQYAEFTARPPFYESRRPQPFYLTNEAEAQAPSFDYVLTSVLITPGFRMAILQPSQGGKASGSSRARRPAPRRSGRWWICNRARRCSKDRKGVAPWNCGCSTAAAASRRAFRARRRRCRYRSPWRRPPAETRPRNRSPAVRPPCRRPSRRRHHRRPSSRR